jgi:hypothetical protein
MTSRKQPIDPICALCRIVSLNFKDLHTKIGINGHAINIQEPSSVQSLLRIYYGDNREDVFELFYLVTHLLAWFLVPVYPKIESQQNEFDDEQIPQTMKPKKQIDEKFVEELKKMINYMCIGLERLQSTYKNGNVVLAIQYYINLMRDGLNGNFSLERLPQCLLEDLDIDTNMKTKIISMWNYDRLHVVCDLYDNCFSELKKNMNKKTDIIDGYLLSINSILSVYEKEFKTQLKQW